jgi:hypothetical protein
MGEYLESEYPTRSESSAYTGSSGWVGWIAFAATMLVLIGSFHVIQGLVALFKDEYYLVGSSGLVVNVDYTAWGWVHIIAGAIAIGTGFGLFSGQMWARVVGTIVAVLSAIVNVAFLAAYPIWSTLMIALCVIIILALTVHGSEMKGA